MKISTTIITWKVYGYIIYTSYVYHYHQISNKYHIKITLKMYYLDCECANANSDECEQQRDKCEGSITPTTWHSSHNNTLLFILLRGCIECVNIPCIDAVVLVASIQCVQDSRCIDCCNTIYKFFSP